ncbi:MAG TPA: hypothetical protein VLW53_22255 [Candidatus Eisenbacteria bacterium]|nr:hypothetical protein [Candidatus Eisenbacteria bacterium]
MHVNIGGDPGRDDYGLPPVDIEVPDDARELDREVQAYHRELRALRWRRRTRWLVVPLGRDGMVLPLLAGCLALTLLAGTLLTVFSGEQMTPPSLGRSGRQLPDAIVLVAGAQEHLRSLRPAVLALVPPGCRCTDLRQLAKEAKTAKVQIYIVGTPGVQTAYLARQNGLAATNAVEDTEGVLSDTYHPATLTAVLVDVDGSVATVVHDRGKGFRLTAQMHSLVPHPGGTGTASVAAGPAGG